MPIGLLSDDEFFAELQSAKKDAAKEPLQNQLPRIESHLAPQGRREGDVNTPESLRKIIGEESVINGRQSALNLAAQFGISPSSVSAYARGATSTASYDTPVKSLIGHINKSRLRATKRASTTLNAALAAISQEKLDYTDAKDLSTIAKNMSAIIKDLEPPPEQISEVKQQTQFVIYAPSFRKEESFEVIDVQE